MVVEREITPHSEAWIESSFFQDVRLYENNQDDSISYIAKLQNISTSMASPQRAQAAVSLHEEVEGK